MKVQIRHNVFETNSSSVHTLVLVKPNDKSINDYFDMAQPEVKDYVLKNGLSLRNDYYNDNHFVISTPLERFKFKLQELYCSYVNRESQLSDYIDITNIIKNIASKIGVNGDVICPKNIDDLSWEYENSLLTYLEEYQIAAYLFDDESVYYTFCDECGEIDPFVNKHKDGYDVIRRRR